MKYSFLLPVIAAQVFVSAPAFAWVSDRDVRTYLQQPSLNILNVTFSTDGLRQLYGTRNAYPIWFTSSGRSNRLDAYLGFLQRAPINDRTRALLNVLLKYNSSVNDNTSITMEFVASQSLLEYVGNRLTPEQINSLLYGSGDGLVNYLKQLANASAAPSASAPAASIANNGSMGSAAAIQSYLKNDKILLLGKVFDPSGLRAFYSTRGYRSVWFDSNGQKAEQLPSFLSFAKFNDSVNPIAKQILIPAAQTLIENTNNKNWIQLELVTTHILLLYLKARNVTDFTDFNKSGATTENFMYYVRNLRAKEVVKAIPVDEDPVVQPQPPGTPGTGLPPRAVTLLPEILMPEAPLGYATARYVGDPTTGEMAKFNAYFTMPLFTNPAGQPNGLADQLRDVLHSANRHGLNADDYWNTPMEDIYQAAKTSANDFEKYARQALLRYVFHLSSGRLNAKQIDPTLLKFDTQRFSDYETLASLLTPGPGYPLKNSLEALAPQMNQYRQLMRNLAFLQNLKNQGGLTKIAAPSKDLKVGVTSPVIPVVRVQLAKLGYTDTGSSDLYDDSFTAVTKEYMSGNGIPSKIDSRFWTSINKTVDERILQVQLNLEKLRWIPHVDLKKYSNRYAFVNLAAQEVNLTDSGVSIMKFRTINGRIDRPTPSMLQHIRSVVLNPNWSVPLNLAEVDKIPLIRDDPAYLIEHRYKVLQSRLNRKVRDSQPLDVRFLSQPYLDSYTRDQSIRELLANFPNADDEYARISYMNDGTQAGLQRQQKALLEIFLSGLVRAGGPKFYLEQQPNNLNALGVLKFPLRNLNGETNEDDIYMHDTNERDLFPNAVRYNSSGCIRLQYPIEFATELFKGTDMTMEAIKARIPWDDVNFIPAPADEENEIRFPRPVLVYVLHMTADQTDSGAVRTFDDAYGLDAKILEALKNSH